MHYHNIINDYKINNVFINYKLACVNYKHTASGIEQRKT